MQLLINNKYDNLAPTPFLFEHSSTAAIHNSKIIMNNDFDLSTIMNSTMANTHLQYGSEFLPTSELDNLLKHHPLWPRTKKILVEGVHTPLTPMYKELEREDLIAGLARENHKGATSQPKLLDDLAEVDVTYDFALPITMTAAKQMKSGRSAPLNIQTQWTIDEDGTQIKKKRLSHDQSFAGLASTTSINIQVIIEDLGPLIYGFMFLRLCHMIHTMRLAHPYTSIIITKIDLDAAFRRMHLNTKSAAKCICTTTICALIYLRLTFGGSFSPAEWCIMIEILKDLANDITNNPIWNPTSTLAPIPAPASIPPPTYLPPQIPFSPALLADVDLPLPHHETVDSYVDDIISLCLDICDNASRCVNAILLTIYLLASPFSTNLTEK